MTFTLPLTEDDKNFLIETKENTELLNQQIEESSNTISTEIAKLLLIDTPFKKQLDPIHVKIFEFEEELRYLNGTSIINPLQETCFSIYNESGNLSRLIINNGRLSITENGSDIVNIPLYPVRGFSRSQQAGKNFNIWSRDRYGSTTSKKHVSTFFTINDTHRKLKVRFDGTLDTQIDMANIINIIQDEETLVVITSGSETDVTLSQKPVTIYSETISLVSGEIITNLVRDTDYTINYTTGLIEFLTDIPPDNEIIASYHNEVQLEASAIASTIQLLLQQSNELLPNVACIFNESIKTFTIVSSHAGPTASVEVIEASDSDMLTMLGFDEQFKIQGKYQNNLLHVKIDGEDAEIKIADFRECFEDDERGFNNDDLGFDWTGSLSTPLGFIGSDRVGPLFCSGIDNGKDVARSIEAQLRIIGTGGFKDASVHYFSDSETFIIYSGTMGISSSVEVLEASDTNRDVRALLGFDPPQEQRGNEEYYSTLEVLYNKLESVPNIKVYGLVDGDILSHSILYTKLEGVRINNDFQYYDIKTTKIYDNGSRGLPTLYPNGKLTINSLNDKIDFWETTNVEKNATIAHGIYDSEADVAVAIADALNTATGSQNYTCTYTQQKKFVVAKQSGNFALLWNTGMNSLYSIGNYIGFSVLSDNIGSGSYTSSIVSFQMTDYFYPSFVNQFDGVPKVIDSTVDEKSALYKEEEYLENETSLSFLFRMLALVVYDNEITITAWEDLAVLELLKVDQQYTAIFKHRGAYANHISETDAIFNQKTIAYNNLLPNRSNLADNLAYHNKLLNVTSNTKIFVAGADFTNGGTQNLNISVPVGLFNNRIYNNPPPFVKYQSTLKHIPGVFNPYGLLVSSVSFIPKPLPVFNITCDPHTQGYSYSAPDADGYDITDSSNSSATVLSSNSGPYNMSAGDTLFIRVDNGGVQTATFDALPGYTESRIVVANRFIIETGANDKIDFSESVGIELTATIPSGSYSGSELATQVQNVLDSTGNSNYTVDYNNLFPNKFTILSDGSGGTGIFELLWNSGTNSSISSAYIMGFDNVDDTSSLVYVSDNDTILPVVTNINDSFSISIDGIASANSIIIPQGRYTVLSIINELTNQISNDPRFDGSDFNITYPGSKFRITSTTLGNSSIVEVFEGNNDFLRTIALDGDVPVHGGSDVLDIDNVTVDEVVTVLNAEITGISASNDSNKVRITTLSTKGSISSIVITGGTCRTIIGFDTSIRYGADRNNLLKVDIDGDETKDPISVMTSQSSISGYDLANNIGGLLRAIGTGGYTLSDCTFNETTVFQTFTNQLRIISGTFDAASSVYISDKTIKIVSSTNDNIRFREIPSVTLNATLSPGFYNPTTLATEIKTQLESIGSNTYTVTYSSITKKMTIVSSGAYFSLLFNVANSVASDIGFTNSNFTGGLTYTSSGLVKWGSCHEELGFDTQTLEPGHILDSVKLTITDTNFSTRLYWSDNGGGNRLDLNIDLSIAPNNTILGLIDTITQNLAYTINYSSAFLLSRIPSLYKIDHGDDLILEINDEVPITIEFDAEKPIIQSDAQPVTRIYSGSDRLDITINESTIPINLSIDIGTQLNPTNIASKIQQEIRAKYDSNLNIQAALSLFQCLYTGGLYNLILGAGGTSLEFRVQNTVASQSLKINNKYSIGSGDVANSCFVSAIEVVNKINNASPTGLIASVYDSNYIMLTSTEEDNTTKIKVSGSIASKIGFDLYNNEAYPLEDLGSINSISLIKVTDVDIKDPIIYSVARGWDTSKGNVEIVYSTTDNSRLQDRQQIVTDRLISISTRKPQITTRVSQIEGEEGELTPSLYNSRKDQVTIRLNKKTGPYVKVGDKLGQQENNESTIDTNDDFINEINTIIGP